MTDTNRILAELLFPHIDKTPADWLAQYPPRDLPPTAKVTRFAPSPTGFVHIGGVLTSLTARRLAHQTGGVFILRIEDTDKKRELDGSVEAIVRNLINFDLRPDEGIVQLDPEVEVGAYGPYTQSERREIYETFIKALLMLGLAYPSFDSDEELERMRKAQEAQKVKTGYYGRWALWREATLEMVKARLEAGERPAIRIRAPYPNEARARFTDAIKGDLDLPANDQDMVLLKSSNSLPTYHFAHVIDDALMRVNIVIRGDEWLPSAPLHVQILDYLEQVYAELPPESRALAPARPAYAHVAPVAKMDGSSKRKLSKRKDPEANVAYFHEAGYPVQAITEYLLNLLNSDFYDWRKANPNTPHSEFPIRLEAMGVASPLFDVVKLNDISKDVIATYSAAQVYEYGLAWAKQYRPALAQIIEADPDYSLAVFSIERTGDAPRKDLVNWSDIERAYGFMFDAVYDVEIAANGYAFGKLVPEDTVALLERSRAFDPAVPKEEWLAQMRAFGETLGFARDVKTFKKSPEAYKGHFGDVMNALRVALTGRTQTPDLYEIMQVMGMARVAARIDRALSAALVLNS